MATNTLPTSWSTSRIATDQVDEIRSGREAVVGQQIGRVALVVRDYDEAIAYYTRVLGFDLVEDTALGGGKRWVVVAPPGSAGAALLLARAASPGQQARVG